MFKLRVLGLFVAVSVFAISFSGMAQAGEGCPDFPKVIWWKASHQKTISYVSREHGGNWSPYLAKWDKQLNKMESLYAGGGTAVFKSKGLRLEGEMLKKYVQAIKGRLTVSKCLAQSEIANAANKKSTSANDG